MTSTHDTCRAQMASASVTAFIITISEGWETVEAAMIPPGSKLLKSQHDIFTSRLRENDYVVWPNRKVAPPGRETRCSRAGRAPSGRSGIPFAGSAYTPSRQGHHEEIPRSGLSRLLQRIISLRP